MGVTDDEATTPESTGPESTGPGSTGLGVPRRPPERDVLFPAGVPPDFLWVLVRARKEGRARPGNGRRQSYQHLPMVRMTNTYLVGGESDPDDIVADTPTGVYIAHLGGGQVNTATGEFVFGMSEG